VVYVLCVFYPVRSFILFIVVNKPVLIKREGGEVLIEKSKSQYHADF